MRRSLPALFAAMMLRSIMHITSMKALLLPVLCLPVLCRAELREFKNTKGQTLKAEPVVVQGANLTLKLADGKQSTIPIKSLSPDDQTFILRWMVHEPKALSYNFTCSSEEKGGAVEKKSSRLGKMETEQRFYNVKVGNRCQNPIDNLKVAYRVFMEDRVKDTGEGNEEPAASYKGGLLDLGRLTFNQSTSFSTSSLPVQNVTPNSLAGFAGVDVKPKKDKMRGVWVKFYRHGVEVGEWKSPGLVKCEWPESAAEKTALETDAAENKKRADAAAAPPAPAPETAKPAAPVKLSSDEMPQDLKIFEFEDAVKK